MGLSKQKEKWTELEILEAKLRAIYCLSKDIDLKAKVSNSILDAYEKFVKIFLKDTS